MKRRVIFLALMALAIFSISPLSQGAGFLIYEHGAAAMAMGGAFVALANDATAVFHNPAGIAFLEGTQVSVGTTLIIPSSTLTMPGIGLVDPSYATSYEKESQVFFPSTVYITHKFSDRIVAGFGFFSPYGLGAKWPADYPLRYIAVKDDMKTFFFNPTIAIKLSDNLSIGAGVSYIYSTLSFELAQLIILAPGPPPVTADVPVTLEANGDGWGLNAGLLYKGEKFSLGFNWRGSIKIDYTEGDLALDLSEVAPGISLPGTASTAFSFPHILGVGATIQLTDQLLLTADIHYILWSSFDEFTVEVDVPGLEAIYPPGFEDTIVEENWEDSFTFRGGLQYMVNENFSLRAGFLYDQTPQPVETMDPLLPDADRWAFTGGFGYKSGRFAVDVAYQYEPFKDRTSPNRDVYPAGLGEGTYSTTAHLISVSIGFMF